MKSIGRLFKRRKTMSEIKKERKVKLKHAPNGKPSSNNNNIGSGDTYVLGGPCTSGKGYKTYFITKDGYDEGWVYEHEIDNPLTKEYITKQIDELQSEIDCFKSKLDWMDESGVDEYDEDEYKVYETLKTLENNTLDIKDKTKLIVSLIKGRNC